jgi:ribosomal protein L25 (general stress protein Ctc)
MTGQPVQTQPAGETGARRRGRASGTTPRWELLYTAMETIEPGQLMGYEQMGSVLCLDVHDPKEKQAILTAANKAARQLRIRQGKIFRVVHGRGYECIHIEQMTDLVYQYQARARAVASAGAAHAAIATMDLDELDSTTAGAVRAIALAFVQQAARMRQLDVRQNRLDTAIAAADTTAQTAVTRTEQATIRAAATQASVDALTERISALERERPGSGAAVSEVVTPTAVGV